MTLDIANELIQFKPKDTFSLALARSLRAAADDDAAQTSGGPTQREMWRGGEQGLAEDYDYVMHGKVRHVSRARARPGQLMCRRCHCRSTSLTIRRGAPIKREQPGCANVSGRISDRMFDSTAYISFGGLLLALRSNYRHLQHIVIGENVFLLIRK